VALKHLVNATSHPHQGERPPDGLQIEKDNKMKEGSAPTS
jgi:hypothetical protein